MCLLMLGGLLTVLQAPLVDGVLFDPFSCVQDLVAAAEVFSVSAYWTDWSDCLRE
jgi:hypothetical protein